MWSPQGSIFGPVFVCLYAVPVGLLLNSFKGISYFAMLMIHSYTFLLGPTTSRPSPTSANASLPLIFACIYIFSISTLIKRRLLCSALTTSPGRPANYIAPISTNIRSSKNLGIIYDLQLKFEIHL